MYDNEENQNINDFTEAPEPVEPVVEASEVQTRQKRKLPFWLGILVGIAAVSVLFAVMITVFGLRMAREDYVSQSNADSTSIEAAESKIGLIKNLVDQYYLWDIDEDLMEEKIVDGYVAGLDDKYAEYYTAEEFEELKEMVSGSYAGIGVSITMEEDGNIVVYKVFSGSPAEEAGIHVGDVIVEAAGERNFETIDDIVEVVRGVPGTTVDLVIDRDGEEIPFTVERANISMDMISYKMLDDNIGYIYIEEFEEVAAEQFNAALDDLEAQGMESLILDLRDNPGGDYDTVVAMADRILPEGPIMTVKDRSGTIVTENSDADHYIDIPMAVLINGNSASASEVFVGAIQDYDMAVIIGEQSYGKGIVQSIFTFPDGSGVKFSTQEYYTPSGDSIHGVGITPDIVIEIPEEAYEDGYIDEDEDVQLQKAIEVLSE